MVGRRNPDRGPRSERGASAVEFALILPVLITLLGGIINFGFVFSQQIALNNAVRDAARTAVVKPVSGNPKTCLETETAAKANMQGGIGMNSASVTLAHSRSDAAAICASGTAYPCTSSTQGVNYQLTATYTSRPPFPIPYLTSFPLSAKGVFRCEYS